MNPVSVIDIDQGGRFPHRAEHIMEEKRQLIAVAYKMIATFGDRAAEKMDSIVADHDAVEDSAGADFWSEVARTVRRLQVAILFPMQAS